MYEKLTSYQHLKPENQVIPLHTDESIESQTDQSN